MSQQNVDLVRQMAATWEGQNLAAVVRGLPHTLEELPDCALHRIAVTQKRMHEPAKRYLAQKQAEGKTNREALRCLKRQLVRKVLGTLRATPPNEENPPGMINNLKEPLPVAVLT